MFYYYTLWGLAYKRVGLLLSNFGFGRQPKFNTELSKIIKPVVFAPN